MSAAPEFHRPLWGVADVSEGSDTDDLLVEIEETWSREIADLNRGDTNFQ